MLDIKTTLPVMEHFYTIQGEGCYTGNAAYFIRLGGCNVGCHWCDVKESWPMENHPLVSIENLLIEIKKYPSKIVVVTGGEPLMHDLSALTYFLKKDGYKTHIETSGAYPLTGDWDWICVSPKKFKRPLEEYYKITNELKVIVFNKSDFEFAEINQSLFEDCNLFLQPEWGNVGAMATLVVEYAKQNPAWKISLQTHKYLDIP